MFLNQKEVELNEEISFTLNKYFTSISNPNERYVEFSKTVSVPMTLSNNQLFNSIYSPDRLISYSDVDYLAFDPYAKIDLILLNDDDVLMVGYAKMLSVDWNGEKGVYNLNLYGELGKVFGELSKVTFDKTGLVTEEDFKHYIDGSIYYKETLNRQLIYDSWNNNQNYIPLVRITDTTYSPYNIVGWTPLNIRYDSDTLDQKSFELSDGTTKTFTEVLEQLTNPTFVDATKCNPDTAVGDGLMPREIGEWRSYLQQPFMYFNKLMQLMADKCKLLTGYEFLLDPNWFQGNNPFYKDVVFTLKNFEKDDFVSNTYGVGLPGKNWTSNYATEQVSNMNFTSPNEVEPILNSDNTFKAKQQIGFSFNGNFKLDCTATGGTSFADNNAFIININRTNANGIKQIATIIAYSEGCTVLNQLKNFYKDAYYFKSDLASNGAVSTVLIPFSVGFNSTNEVVSFSVTTRFYADTYPFKRESRMAVFNPNGDITLQANVYTSYNRSDATITLNTLWNNDVKPFDLIMQYCKMFRIGIFADNVNKKVKFIPYSTYFSQYEILDWSDKLDKSLEYQIKPITYENKWVKFNYDDNSTKLNEKYNKQFGLQFGEYKIDTHYVFNDETEELFEDIKCPLESTDNVLSWTNLYNNKRIVYSFPAEKYVYSKDGSDKLQDNFGTFYLDGGVVDFDTEERLYLRSNTITDDSRNMRGSGKYVYNQYGDKLNTTKYHQLSTFVGKCMMTYTAPSYTFCYQDYSGRVGLYETFWKNYLQERYDVQNKIVTCFFKLKNSDWTNFDFNKFIKIDNQLYFVNKIFDYNPASNEPTKCELITIQDILGYIKDNYNYYLTITPETATTTRTNGSVSVDVESTQDVYVTSSIPTYILIDGKTLSSATPQTISKGKHTITTNGVPAEYKNAVITFRSGTYTKTLTITFTSVFDLHWYDASAIGGLGAEINNNAKETFQSGEEETWILRSSSDWTWDDVNKSLQDFKINDNDGSGSGSASLVGELLSIDTSQMSQGLTGVIKFANADGDIINVNIEIV